MNTPSLPLHTNDTYLTDRELAQFSARRDAEHGNESLDIHLPHLEAALRDGSFLPFQGDLHVYVREYLTVRGIPSSVLSNEKSVRAA